MNLPPDLIAAAQAAMRETRVPASVSLAQYGLESGWGQHMPPLSNNPFGIKALPGQPFVIAQTHEFVGGRHVAVSARFRQFGSLAEAFQAHAALIASASPYAPAMAKLPDLEAFVRAMAHPYATDPGYADKLMAIIRDDQLERFDQP